jgi:hypothetical protein
MNNKRKMKKKDDYISSSIVGTSNTFKFWVFYLSLLLLYAFSP